MMNTTQIIRYTDYDGRDQTITGTHENLIVEARRTLEALRHADDAKAEAAAPASSTRDGGSAYRSWWMGGNHLQARYKALAAHLGIVTSADRARILGS